MDLAEMHTATTSIPVPRWCALGAAFCVALVFWASNGQAAEPSPAQVHEPATEQAYAPDVSPAAMETVQGQACVIDGDTLAIGGQRTPQGCAGGRIVDLIGADAPELGQKCRRHPFVAYACGRFARTRLTQLTRKNEIQCIARLGRGGRYLGQCFVGENNLSAQMVEAGFAAVDPKGSKIFSTQEQEAKRGRRGIWRTEFDLPWDWRRKPT